FIGSHWFFARTGPKTIARMNPTTATAPAIMPIKPQETATFGPFPFATFGFTLTAPLGEAVNAVLHAGHFTFLPTSSSFTLSRFPHESQTTKIAMAEFSNFHFKYLRV